MICNDVSSSLNFVKCYARYMYEWLLIYLEVTRDDFLVKYDVVYYRASGTTYIFTWVFVINQALYWNSATRFYVIHNQCTKVCPGQRSASYILIKKQKFQVQFFNWICFWKPRPFDLLEMLKIACLISL